MNKILSKEKAVVMRLRNVLRYNQDLRNELISQYREAKKAKDKEEQSRLIAVRGSVEKNIADLLSRIEDAERVANEVAIELAINRTKVYVLSYCLQGAVFETKEFIKQHATNDGGELEFLNELKNCSDLLMKMPMEFGTYGGSDNEAYNVCEEIISDQVDKGVRAAFQDMLEQEKSKIT